MKLILPCSATHAAGQTVVTAKVQTHSIDSAFYALQAVYRETNSLKEVEKERTWQHNCLLKLKRLDNFLKQSLLF